MEKITNRNDVEYYIYVLPRDVESPKADVLDQSAALTTPASEWNKGDNGVKLRVRHRLYLRLWEGGDLKGMRVGRDNRMLWVVLGKQVLAA